MSLLDTASLIVTPNGYKEGKLYSVIPSDGSGDMSVTRATTATRVNSAGLVELVPYNLLQYSQEFDNAWWSKYQATITANATIAPDGTTSAESITNNLSAVASVYKTGITNFGTNTISCYFKKGTYNYVFLELGGNSYNFCSFNIATGTVEVISGFSNVTIEDAGNGWWRCYATASDSASTITAGFGTAGSPTAGDVTYIWGAQIVEGSVAKDYQKTETRLNIPRLDYSNGTCPSLLVEPQRTNLAKYSQDITNAVWDVATGGGGASAIRTANYGIAPDGTMSADRLQLNKGASGYAECFQYPISITNGATYTFSAYVKSLSGNVSFLFGFNGSAREIENATTEWTRITWTTTAVGTVGGAAITLYDTYDPNTSASVDLLVWGFQVELGSYATSYIPTTSASVTRNADVISKTGISSLIGQTEGTIYLDVDFDNLASQTNNPVLVSLFGNASIYLQIFTSGYGELIYSTGAGVQAYLYWPSVTNGHHKIAFGYKANDFVLYVDGAQVATDTSGSVDTLSSLYLGYSFDLYNPSALYNSVALWKTRLTNTQLAQLTTI